MNHKKIINMIGLTFSLLDYILYRDNYIFNISFYYFATVFFIGILTDDLLFNFSKKIKKNLYDNLEKPKGRHE